MEEVIVIRKTPAINLFVHFPTTEYERKTLADRVADLHAAAVTQRLKTLNDSEQQQPDLLEAIIKTAKKRSQERE